MSQQQAFEGSGIVPVPPVSPSFIDVGVNTNLAVNTGYFVTAACTLTLPAAPAQGTLEIIYVDTIGQVIVQANTGQVIEIADIESSVAGTATNDKQGDSLTLRYRAADSKWCCVGPVGSWQLA